MPAAWRVLRVVTAIGTTTATLYGRPPRPAFSVGPLGELARYSQHLADADWDRAQIHHGPNGAALLPIDHARWEMGELVTLLTTTLARIQQILDQARRPLIAMSGGKDSIVLTALVHQIDPAIPVLWSDDELEYPEVVGYMRALATVAGVEGAPEMYWLEGGGVHAGWFRPWERPYFRAPDSRMLWRDREIPNAETWQAAAGYDTVFTGLRAAESRKRRDWLIAHAPLYRVRRDSVARAVPIWDWTEADVWALIAGWDLPYPAVYDRLAQIGVERHRQRVGPLPLARRADLERGWPDLWTALTDHFGSDRWPATP